MNMIGNVFSTSLAERRRQAARRFSNFDKSDPFAYSRALTHIENGIVSFRTDRGGKEIHCHYDTDTRPHTHPVDERWAPLMALSKTREVHGTAYSNICRP